MAGLDFLAGWRISLRPYGTQKSEETANPGRPHRFAQGPAWAIFIPSLRGCDFFVFLQKQILKTNDLCAKKSHKFKKVTNS
jgi:hypothetical protein